MRNLLGYWILGVLLASCETRQPASTSAPARPVAPQTAVAVLAAPVPAARPDTADYTRSHLASGDAPSDNMLVALGGRHYWLQMTQVTDSAKPIDFAPARLVGRAFAAPSDTAWLAHRIRGYEGTYTFTLRDSARRTVVFRQLLHKRDFPEAAADEVLTVSEPELRYLGYSAGLHSLVFVVYLGIPYSDVISRTLLLLDARTGRVQRIADIGSGSFEATDCDPQPAPDGQTVLTCTGEVLRAGRPPLSLRQPHAELRATRFLTDTTLLVVYEFGDYRPVPPEVATRSASEAPVPVAGAPVTAEMTATPQEFFSTSAQRRLPNAFVLGISGRVLARFRYDGWDRGMAYYMPRLFSIAARTYYLPNDTQELILLPKTQPGTVLKLPFKSLPKFKAPLRPHEKMYEISGEFSRLQLYVDTLYPRSVRYRRLSNPAG